MVAAHPGNSNRLVHGAYSRRDSLDPVAAEIADLLMEAPHIVALDRFAAEEIGALIVQLDRVDAALADGRVERNGKPRGLIDLRSRLSGRLEAWLKQFGMTPQSRSEWAARLASGGLGAEIRRRLEEERDDDGGQ